MESPGWKLEEWDVERLKVNPLQRKYFRTRTPEELAELAQMILRNFMEPIDILPCGTILCGHQRRLVALHYLHWPKVPVRIRYDLEAAGPQAWELFFLEHNRASRQLTPLELARSFRRCLQLEQDLAAKSPKGRPRGRLRERVAKQFGMSGRTMEDLCKILDTPQLIQEELEAKRLSRTEAIAIAKAPVADQQAIAELIGNGMAARKAMRKVIGLQKRGPLTKSKLTRRWRDWGRIAADLHSALPEALDAILTEHHYRLRLAVEIADAVGQILPRPRLGQVREKETEPTPEPQQVTQVASQPSPKPHLAPKPRLLPKPTSAAQVKPLPKPGRPMRTLSELLRRRA